MNPIDPELLSRYLNNQVSTNERKLVEDWMRENDISGSSLEKLLNPSQGVRLMASLDTEGDWEKVRKKISTKQIFLSPLLKVAASFVLAACIGFAVYYLAYRKTPDQLAYRTVYNTSAGTKKLSMDDGSFLYLNAGAKVTFPENFTSNRSVALQGEAFFDIKRDASNPFTIQARTCQVKVLGTSFLVNADSAFVEVVVKTGRVAFHASENNRTVLEKNESAFYNLVSSVLRRRTALPNAFSWQSHILVFEDTPLDKVIADLEKYFHIRINLIRNNQNDLPQYTSRFENPSIKDVLEEMKLLLPIEYSMTASDITIRVKAN
jgi:transmembrane sensor